MRHAASALLVAWFTLVAGLLLWPILHSGEVLAWRDMSVAPRMQLTADLFGLYSSWPRAVPQDAVLAVGSTLIPAPLIVRALLVVAAIAACVGSWWLGMIVTARSSSSGRMSHLATAVVGTLTLYNPYVVERFSQGHWSLVIACWLLPLITAAALSGRLVTASLGWWLASLTPTGAVIGGIAIICCGVRTTRAFLFTVVTGLFLTCPWWIPPLVNLLAPDPLQQALGILEFPASTVTMFAPRAEDATGVIAAVVTLGGIWNSYAVPASRSGGAVIVSLILLGFVLIFGAHRAPLRLWITAGVGLVLSLAPVVAPQVFTQLLTGIPALGILRDSTKFSALLLPFMVAAAAAALQWWSTTLTRQRIVAALMLAACLGTVPDAFTHLAPLGRSGNHPATTPHTLNQAYAAAQHAPGCRTLVAGASDLIIDGNGHLAVNPLLKATGSPPAELLVVDGQLASPANREHQLLTEAYLAGDMTLLARHSVALVVDENGGLHPTGILNCQPAASRKILPPLLTFLWLAMPVFLLLSGGWRRRGRDF